MVVFLLITSGIIVFILWCFYESKKYSDFYKNIPGPPTVPIFGNALEFKSTTDLLVNLIKYRDEFGDLFKIQIGPFRKILIVSNYKFLEFIFSSTQLIEKSHDYKFLRPWLGTGLLTSAGPKWKSHRRVLTPAFHFQILKQFIDTFESCSQTLVEKFNKELNKDNIDIYPLVTLCSLDIICETAMGVSINAQNYTDSDYVRSVKHMCRIIIERTLSPLEMYDFLYPLTANYYTQRRSLKILHNHTKEVIINRQKERKVKKDKVSENDFSTKKKAFLDLILDITIDGKPLTLNEIREEVETFMFEGHDTTASAVSFILYSLANYPEVQKRAFNEQRLIFGDNKNSSITYKDLQNMKYLELVIKETLRLYPSVPIFGRQISTDGDYNQARLPKGNDLLIFVYGIHRDPNYFKNPLDFDPSRFEDMDGSQPYAYIPFSAGPRNCIGQKFAMLAMKSTVSKILRNFELKPSIPSHTLNLTGETILKSTNGIRIGIKRRN